MLPEQIVPRFVPHRLRVAIHIGEAPLRIEGIERVADTVDDVLDGRLRFQPESGQCQLGVDPRQQFARRKGFDHVPISASLQAFDPRLLTCARREQNDGQRAQMNIRTHLLEQTKAIEARHHHIRDHQIGPSIFNQRQPGDAVRGGLHEIARF